jgi:hypothetical protein
MKLAITIVASAFAVFGLAACSAAAATTTTGATPFRGRPRIWRLNKQTGKYS